MNIKGEIVYIYPEKEGKYPSVKFVVQMKDDYFPMVCYGQIMNEVLNLNEGSIVSCTCELQGAKWEKDPTETIYFLKLKVTDMDVLKRHNPGQIDFEEKQFIDNREEVLSPEQEGDDLPF